MHKKLQKVLSDLQELSSNCGDNRGRDGEYLSDKVETMMETVRILKAEAILLSDGLTRIEAFMRQQMTH